MCRGVAWFGRDGTALARRLPVAGRGAGVLLREEGVGGARHPLPALPRHAEALRAAVAL